MGKVDPIGTVKELGRERFGLTAPTISRRHCRVTYVGPDRFLIEDLGSTNGVWVNGQRVRRCEVGPNDEVKLGSQAIWLPAVFGFTRQCDVTKEFDALRAVYEEYYASKLNMEKHQASTQILLRYAPAVAIMGISLLAFNDRSMQVIGMLIGFVLLLVSVVVSAKKIRGHVEHRSELTRAFTDRWICPNCHRSLGSASWEALKHQGECAHCHATWNGK